MGQLINIDRANKLGDIVRAICWTLRCAPHRKKCSAKLPKFLLRNPKTKIFFVYLLLKEMLRGLLPRLRQS